MVASVAARCATGQRSWFNDLHPRWTARLIPLGVGLACFTITEVMHYLLVPDIGRRKERWLAEAVSAFLVSVLVTKIVAIIHQQYQVMLARTQVISEMNHHIRNALMAISASAYLTENQECIRMISKSVYRIDWALREILPRMQPLPEVERTRLMFLVPRSPSASGQNNNLDLSLSFGERK